jgi:hypothetical protein
MYADDSVSACMLTQRKCTGGLATWGPERAAAKPGCLLREGQLMQRMVPRGGRYSVLPGFSVFILKKYIKNNKNMSVYFISSSINL